MRDAVVHNDAHSTSLRRPNHATLTGPGTNMQDVMPEEVPPPKDAEQPPRNGLRRRMGHQTALA
jgi:hypothetical protein